MEHTVNSTDTFRVREAAEMVALARALIRLRDEAKAAVALCERLHPGRRSLTDPLRLCASHARDVALSLIEMTEADPSRDEGDQAPPLRLWAGVKSDLDSHIPARAPDAGDSAAARLLDEWENSL